MGLLMDENPMLKITFNISMLLELTLFKKSIIILYVKWIWKKISVRQKSVVKNIWTFTRKQEVLIEKILKISNLTETTKNTGKYLLQKRKVLIITLKKWNTVSKHMHDPGQGKPSTRNEISTQKEEDCRKIIKRRKRLKKEGPMKMP